MFLLSKAVLRNNFPRRQRWTIASREGVETGAVHAWAEVAAEVAGHTARPEGGKVSIQSAHQIPRSDVEGAKCPYHKVSRLNLFIFNPFLLPLSSRPAWKFLAKRRARWFSAQCVRARGLPTPSSWISVSRSVAEPSPAPHHVPDVADKWPRSPCVLTPFCHLCFYFSSDNDLLVCVDEHFRSSASQGSTAEIARETDRQVRRLWWVTLFLSTN